MPNETGEKNYDLILHELNKVKEENKKLREEFNEIVSFNKALLEQSDTTPRGNKADRKEELGKKLKEGLRNG